MEAKGLAATGQDTGFRAKDLGFKVSGRQV